MSVAVVTGGARGIGAGVAKRLRADGHQVAVLDVDVTGAEGDAVIDCDVASEGSVAVAFDMVTSALGPPSIVVNNAGFARDQPLHEMPLSDWDAVVDVCLRGAFLTTRVAAPHMMASGFGRIVNISSTSALGDPERVQYVAAKSGLNGFTKAAALELGRTG